MRNKLSDWLRRVTTGWVALAGLLIFVLFSVLVLPGQSAGAETAAGGAGTPDLSFNYSAQDLYRWAEAYGEQGRNEYIRARFTFDLIWPLVYTFFLVTSITWLIARAFPSDSRWQRTNLLPILGMAFDYLENISTSLVMWRFPEQIPLVGTLASVFTMLKWLFISASFLALLSGAIAYVLVWFQRRSAVS